MLSLQVTRHVEDGVRRSARCDNTNGYGIAILRYLPKVSTCEYVRYLSDAP